MLPFQKIYIVNLSIITVRKKFVDPLAPLGYDGRWNAMYWLFAFTSCTGICPTFDHFCIQSSIISHVYFYMNSRVYYCIYTYIHARIHTHTHTHARARAHRILHLLLRLHPFLYPLLYLSLCCSLLVSNLVSTSVSTSAILDRSQITSRTFCPKMTPLLSQSVTLWKHQPRHYVIPWPSPNHPYPHPPKFRNFYVFHCNDTTLTLLNINFCVYFKEWKL